MAGGVAVLALVLASCNTAATPSPVPATTAPSTPAPVATPAPVGTPAAGSPAAGSPAAGGALGAVVMIPKQINNPYFDVAYKGAQKAQTELGGTLTQVGPSDASGPAQVPFIQTATTQKASAILVSADDATAIAPSLQAAMAAGTKVVGYDSSPAVGAYNVFVNQASTEGIGVSLADMACDSAPSCTGEIAVLSASQTATNQNAWIAVMQTTLKGDKYKNLVFDGVYYGNDDPQISTTQTQAMLTAHPNLKVIVAPTTVGIVAAAQVVQAQTLTGKVWVTGLGTPKGMQAYVKGGQCKEFSLWNVTDLGYLTYYVANLLVTGKITGKEGETFTVPNLNAGKPYTILKDSVVVLGPPFVFNAANIDQYVTSFGF
jgi:rhamnose transport system substrate-binding protein